MANALVHRDYAITAAIRIVMYHDRVEITSPGSLPRGISPDEYRRGNVSVPRNEIVAEVFHRLKIIEKFATVIRRIFDEYNPFQEDPLFEIFENSITITLPCVSYKLNKLIKSGQPIRTGQARATKYQLTIRGLLAANQC